MKLRYTLQIETPEAEGLRRLVQEGIDSGPGLEADAVLARLRARFGQPRLSNYTPPPASFTTRRG